jgi:uncharacterized protein YciI
MNPNDICYPILLFKIPGVDTSGETVARHIAHVKNLDDQGKLVLAGPFEDFPGGMVIVRAESLEAAKKIAESDPFVTEGVRTFEVRTWLLANRENGYLG